MATSDNRRSANARNAQHSTGPRPEAGNKRSSKNALKHGLTSRDAVLPTEDAHAHHEHPHQGPPHDPPTPPAHPPATDPAPQTTVQFA